MATQRKTKESVPQMARKTEALSIRIDPKVRYGLELLSRLHRRSVTGVVEWSIIEAFRSNKIADDDGYELSVEAALSRLWSVNELERVMLLYFNYSHLLTFEEERIASVLVQTNDLWFSDKARAFKSFRWADVLPFWSKLKPILFAVSNRATTVGLSEDELKQAGLEHIVNEIPF